MAAKKERLFFFLNFACLSFPLKKLGRPQCKRQILLCFQLTSKWLGRVKGEEVLGNCGDDRNQVAQVDSDFNFVQLKLQSNITKLFASFYSFWLAVDDDKLDVEEDDDGHKDDQDHED